MSIKYRIKTINKNENQLVISGAVKASVPEDLSFQLTGEQGREILCSVGLSKNPLNGDALFAVVASSIEEDRVALTIQKGGESRQVHIDPLFIKTHKITSLVRKANPHNFKKATKFYREYGLKNAVHRFGREVEKHNSAELDYNIWKQFSDPEPEEIEAQKDAWKKLSFEGGKAPVFNIVIPAYNTEREMLLILLDSLKNQTYPNFKVLIADGSSEDSHSVKNTMDEYSKTDPRFVYVPIDGNLGISGNTNAGLEKTDGDFIVFCDHDDELPPWALYEAAKVISENPRVQFIYTDEDKIDIDGVTFFDPHMKSDFNLPLLETCNYICHLNIVRKDLLSKAGFLRSGYDGAQDFDFVLRCSEAFLPDEEDRLEKYRAALLETKDVKELAERSGLLEDSVRKLQEGRFISELAVHIPKICYHWKCNLNSTAFDSGSKLYAYEAGCKAVRDHLTRLGASFSDVVRSRNFGYYKTLYNQDAKDLPKVSVLLVNTGAPQEAFTLLRSLKDSGYPELELLILNLSGSQHSEADYEAGGFPVKILAAESGKNFFEAYNKAAEAATGEYLFLLDKSLVLQDNSSLFELTGQIARRDVGACGPRLIDKTEANLSAGLILATDSVVSPAFRGLFEYDGSYMHRMMCAQSLSALPAEGLFILRDLFLQIGGFDLQLTGRFAAADLCLRIRQLGLRMVYTPYALLKQIRLPEENAEEAALEEKARLLFEERWSGILSSGDPYYNPQFLSDAADFLLGIELDKTDNE